VLEQVPGRAADITARLQPVAIGTARRAWCAHGLNFELLELSFDTWLLLLLLLLVSTRGRAGAYMVACTQAEVLCGGMRIGLRTLPPRSSYGPPGGELYVYVTLRAKA
jgi:hypothetical protein